MSHILCGLNYASMMPSVPDSEPAVLPAGMLRPDYDGAGLVNLMATIAAARGANESMYPPLKLLENEQPERFRNILLIVIDGLGYEFLQQFPQSAIAQHTRGALTSVFPTTTAAAITTFLTGLAPAQHGLTGWHIWLQEIGTLAAVLPFRSRGGHESLTQRGLDPAAVLDPQPLNARLAVDSHVISPARIAFSPFNNAFSRGANIHAYDNLGQFYATIVDVVKADSADKYIYAYWPDLDHVGHQEGIGTAAAMQHFLDIDAGFAGLIEQLENSDTLVLLTADHGVIDTTEQSRVKFEQHRPLTAMLDVPLCGEPRAAYCYVHPGEHTAFENYISAELGDIVTAIPSQRLVDTGLFGPGELHSQLRARVGDFTLLMKEPYIVTDVLPGESPNTLVGVHGGLSAAELYVPLAVVAT